MRMTGNTILMTGGTSGIGRALAEALHARGNTVIVAGRRQEKLDEIVAANPGMEGLAVDLGDEGGLRAFAATVKERYPALNVLVNNAGVAAGEDYTADEVDTAAAMRIVQANITSVIALTAALLPVLRKQAEATLMGTSSGLAFVPLPGGPTYSASKAFVHSWLTSLRYQLRETSVEVLELAPPYVQTELGGPQQAVDPRAMPLDEYVAEVMGILERGAPERGEVLVERVKPMRWAERDGHYEQVLERLGAM